MTALRVLWHRVAALFRPRTLERDLDDELQFHLAMEIAENVRRGMNARDARSAALRHFGGIAAIKETYRDTRGLPMIETAWHDIRYGFRMVARNPGFSFLAILCLTLGIGATTSVCSWIEGILLRPFPLVAHQNRMVAISGFDRNGRTNVSWPDLQDLRKNATLFDTFIAEHIGGTTLSIGNRAERASGSVVSSNYFDALGIRPIMGRGFDPSEDVGHDAHPVTVISYEAWQDRYGGDAGIIGKTQRLNGVQHTIIGVMPQGFSGTFVGYGFQFWVPASMEDNFEGGGFKLDNRGARWIEGFAFLKPGVSIEQAQAEVSAIAKHLEAAFPATNRGFGFQLYPLWQTPFNGAGTLLPTLRISFVVACVVLLIACANVGNLLLVRSFSRRHEMTVRLSVGAGRLRLMKQLLTEGLILSTAATAGGLLIAYWSRDLLKMFFPPSPGIVINFPAEIDFRVLALSAGVSLITTVLFGLVPAMQASKIDLASAIKSESGGVVGGRGKAWVRSGLVLVQVSLSFLLLVGMGLLLKSMRAMQDADPGFNTKVLSTSVDMMSAGYDLPRARNFQDQVLSRMQGAGVDAAAWARVTPFSYRSYPEAGIAVDGFVAQPGEQPVVAFNEVGAGYLGVMGIPLIYGRDIGIEDNETAAPVAVVNEAMVRRFWRGENPVGRRVQVKGRWLRVVGVAKNAKYSSMLESDKPFFYTPLRQSATLGQYLQMRTRAGAEKVAFALARAVKGIDSNMAPGEVLTLRDQVDRMNWSRRAAVNLLAIFCCMALLLAGIGLYGVMSYAVSQGTRELALRIALGATSRQLLQIVMSQGLRLVIAGIAGGIGAALLVTRLMGSLLYRVSPRDPVAFVAASLVIAVAAVTACFLPAWRATRTDPVRALRE
ncbi:MAG TPA: ABC transporter permease [Candidatus Limnocylindrales bacterium]|nr:ABC transporter permease [Candidatus Limnocylindrales bacterium]